MACICQQFFRFAITGAICFGLNLLVLFVMTDLVGLHYLLSTCVSLIVVTGGSFLANRRFTFKVGSAPGQWSRHSSVTLLSFAMAVLTMHLLVTILSMNYLVANMTVSATLMVVNFLISRHWTFAAR